jgi:hypothetical protein
MWGGTRICKWKNETSPPRMRGGGYRRMVEGVNSNMIYFIYSKELL